MWCLVLFYCKIMCNSRNSLISTPLPIIHSHKNKTVDWLWKFSFLSNYYRFVSYRPCSTPISYAFTKTPIFAMFSCYSLSLHFFFPPSNCFSIIIHEFCHFWQNNSIFIHENCTFKTYRSRGMFIFWQLVTKIREFCHFSFLSTFKKYSCEEFTFRKLIYQILPIFREIIVNLCKIKSCI